MKTVVFVRHAKSSWELQVKDEDRTLKERGINDAYLVAKEFRNYDLPIDFTFSSYAARAIHTAMIFARTLALDATKLQIAKELYDFSGESVLQFLKNIDNKHNTILIFGHNNAFTTLVNTLGDKYIQNLPTAGLVKLDFNIDSWDKIGNGKITKVIVPRELR